VPPTQPDPAPTTPSAPASTGSTASGTRTSEPTGSATRG
jgi:hypothetical protein